jgi:hypothetical protein
MNPRGAKYTGLLALHDDSYSAVIEMLQATSY